MFDCACDRLYVIFDPNPKISNIMLMRVHTYYG